MGRLCIIIINFLWVMIFGSISAHDMQAVPLRYEITIEPEIDKVPATFVGNVTIELQATGSSDKIILSAKSLDININSITMTSCTGQDIAVSGIAISSYRKLFMIKFAQKLQQNETYQLTFTYSGTLRNDNIGFYLAKYVDEEGTERKLATTMFAKSNAPLAFPCFDDPAMKAQFTIKLVRSENYHSLSNEVKVKTENLGNGRYLDVFKETSKMSTYLVAFTISDFQHTDKNGIHKIVASSQAIKEGKTRYALQQSAILLKAVEEFIDMKYTFSKVDHVAIPDGFFTAEAQESWGLITYNERVLLYSNRTYTTLDKQSIFTSMTHEFIHQWFGNLVTPSEWKHLWLSEGFATYLQFRIGDLVMPSWKLMEQFPSIIKDRAFEGESSFSRTPLDDAQQQDWVAYLKGASVIRMMEGFLTAPLFRKGLQHYIKKNKFDVAEPSDLYEALQLAVDEDNAANLLGNNTIFDIMTTWGSSEGYPIVKIVRNYNNGEITLEQEEFIPYFFMEKKLNLWYIPINFVFNAKSAEDFKETTADFWLTEKTKKLGKIFSTDGWLISNKQYSGYYRVNYDEINWNRIINFLNSSDFDRIHVLNRAQLIDDAFDLARYGNLDYGIPLSASQYLRQERNYAPFSAFFNAIESLNRYLSSAAIYPSFKNYIIELLTGVHKYLGFDEKLEEDHLDKLNRVNILKWLCSLGHPECRQIAKEKLTNWMRNETTIITTDLQEPLLCGAMKIGNKEEWEFLYRKYETSEDPVERVRFVKILACIENETVLHKFLEKTHNLNSTLKAIDRITALTAIIESGTVGLRTTTNYIRQHFQEFRKLKGMDIVLNTIGSRLTTEEQQNEFTEFKNEHRGIHMAFRPGMTLARLNLLWMNTSLPQITAWFNEHASTNIVV